MDDPTALSLLVLTLVLTLLATGISIALGRRARAAEEERRKRRKAVDEILQDMRSRSSELHLEKYDQSVDTSFYRSYINVLRNYIAHDQSLETQDDIEEQVSASVRDLAKRVEAIEARFPEETALEKVASVNEAILAKQLETLSESVNAMQDKMLNQWDVVKVVFAILGALGGLVLLILAVMSHLPPSAPAG